jgi:predicted nucleic acid-binding protein
MPTATRTVRRWRTFRQLTVHNDGAASIERTDIAVVGLTPEVLSTSAEVRRQTGLLTNDSLVVASMRPLGLSRLATSDRAFERVAGIELYAPDDL